MPKERVYVRRASERDSWETRRSVGGGVVVRKEEVVGL